MIQIKPIVAGFPAENATQLKIRPLIDSTTDLTCNTYWELFNSENKVLAEGNTPITEEEYLLWDATNESLENIVLDKLNLERESIVNN